jgi:hypothetical protein
MTEETRNEIAGPCERLLIDNPSDFQFHAAYIAYSSTFDKTTNPETKKLLNESIIALQKKEIDYQAFYGNINRFRGEESSQFHYGRDLIKTQKKREWRRRAQKQERIKRHRK